MRSITSTIGRIVNTNPPFVQVSLAHSHDAHLVSVCLAHKHEIMNILHLYTQHHSVCTCIAIAPSFRLHHDIGMRMVAQVKVESVSLDLVCAQSLPLTFYLAIMIIPFFVPSLFQCVHTHALLLGSEAVVSLFPVAPPRYFAVASSAAIVAESSRGPSHRAAESVPHRKPVG